MIPSKEKRKIQARLGALARGRYSHCWVCGSGAGLKTAREAYGTRCKRCIEEGRTNEAVQEHDRLLKRLAKLNGEDT